VLIAVYGLIFFFLLYFFYDIPKDYRKLYNSIYTFLEYGFFSWILYASFSKPLFKKIVVVSSILFSLFLVFNYFMIVSNRTDSVAIGIESILIFFFIFFFFYENLAYAKEDFVYAHHCFWISVGILIYLGGSFFINILADSLSDAEFEKFWFLNFIADTIKTLFFSVALVLLHKKGKNSQGAKTSAVPYLDMI